ncbi:hypothetical protein F5Y14DRAFT_447041 [Nemania sp. NC0429]|nr:hypothetical protein F5Y14DRAFT_447041 [Nemania sp. NC0429]
MEGSAPKRRKTSPTTSVPVGNEPNEPSSSDSATRRSSRLNRPSFASPTRASLARSNPDILQRRAPSRAPQPIPAASELGSQTSRHGSADDSGAAQLEHASETGGPGGEHVRGNNDAAVERRGSPVRRAGGALSVRPKRSPAKPSPRPLPPPSTEEEELIDPFKGRRLRRSPPPGVFPAAALREAPEPEPELPPTPTQKGLSDPSAIITSPAGIHSTPSKRPRRSRALAAKMNSSPLKQPPLLRPPESATEVAVETVSSRRLTKEPLRDEPRRKRRKRTSHPARQVEEADPLADKKALRDQLLAEVAQLEDDLKVVANENERLYKLQESRLHGAELPDEKERRRILDVLRRHVLPPDKEAPPDPMRDWLEAAMNPIAFLPFGQSNAAAALPPLPLPSLESDKGKAEEEHLSPPVSHLPVPMTAEEELPYLQVFTPLTFTSTVTTTRQNDAQEAEQSQSPPPLLQRHAISVSSSPRGLFSAAIDMVVDTKTLAIAKLAVPRLDPAALAELAPFLEATLRGARNVGVVAWAMGEWVRVATTRARFWHAASRELGSAARVLRCAEAMRRGTRRKGRGGNAEHEDEDEEDGDGDGDGDAGRRDGKVPPKADIMALMGRTSLDIDLSGVAADGDGGGDDEALVARILWRIEFDWTGEARSKIGLLMSAPAKWRANDEKGSLAGLPDMFDKILQERKDPLEAVKIVVALIVGEGGQS